MSPLCIAAAKASDKDGEADYGELADRRRRRSSVHWMSFVDANGGGNEHQHVSKIESFITVLAASQCLQATLEHLFIRKK